MRIDDISTMADFCRAAQFRAGMKDRAVAQALGISLRSWARIKAGEAVPDVNQARMICDVLGANYLELVAHVWGGEL